MSQLKTDQAVEKQQDHELDLDELLTMFNDNEMVMTPTSDTSSESSVDSNSSDPLPTEVPEEFTVVLNDIEIDNPGGGDCGFYAFSIGLMNIIQHESYCGSRETFNKWALLAPSIAPLYDDILLCKPLTKYQCMPESETLFRLQHSLRDVAYTLYVQKLKQDCADVSECTLRVVTSTPLKQSEIKNVMNEKEVLIISDIDSYYLGFKDITGRYVQRKIENNALIDVCKQYKDQQIIKNGSHRDSIDKALKKLNCSVQSKEKYKDLISNSLFIEFSGLFGEFNNPDDKVRFDTVPEIKKAIGSLKLQLATLFKKRKFSFYEQNQIEDAAKVRLFLQLLYGKRPSYDDITPTSEPLENSPIIKALAQLKVDRVWAVHLDLDTLANYFQLNFHYFKNGHAPQEFKDDLNKHVISINNKNNIHWTTKITISKNKKREREVICELVDTIIQRLREEFTREIESYPLFKDNEILSEEINFLKEEFVPNEEFIRYAQKFSEIDDHTQKIFECITVLQHKADLIREDIKALPELTVLPNEAEITATLFFLKRFANDLFETENAKPLPKAWHKVEVLFKKLIELIANYLDIPCGFEKKYHGPIRYQFWQESPEVTYLCNDYKNLGK